jgi:hypothetical protein
MFANKHYITILNTISLASALDQVSPLRFGTIEWVADARVDGTRVDGRSCRLEPEVSRDG